MAALLNGEQQLVETATGSRIGHPRGEVIGAEAGHGCRIEIGAIAGMSRDRSKHGELFVARSVLDVYRTDEPTDNGLDQLWGDEL
jgi:hypothetical protein